MESRTLSPCATQRRKAVALSWAVAGLGGCVDLQPLSYERDFGAGHAFMDARSGGGGSGGPSDPGGPDSTRPAGDGGLDDARRPGLPDARPPAIRCPEDRDCQGQRCDLDPVCRVSCGTCGDGESCRDGRCVPAPPGCPETRDCAGRFCGLDPVCGVSCGDCPDDEICGDDARCAPRGPRCPEDADCGGGRCGADPVCGTDCGGCPAGEACANGTCQCAPACGGRGCGDDGCGGVCGACAGAETCSADGRCVCEALLCGETCCPLDARCEGGRCCQTTFRVALGLRPYVGPVLDRDGGMLLGGEDAGGPVVVALDACAGEARALGGPGGLEFLAGGAVLAVAPIGEEVVIAGAFGDAFDPSPSAFIGRLERDTLRDRGFRPTVTGWIRSLMSDGGSGVVGVGGDASPAFTVSTLAPDLREECIDDVADAGEGFAALQHGDRRWAAGTSGGQGVLLGFGADCQTWNAAAGMVVCGCDDVIEARLELPETPRLELRALAFGAGGRFAGGFATRPAAADDTRAVLASLQEAALLTRLEWDPTPAADALTGLAMGEGTPLFASAFSGRPTVGGRDDGQARAHLLVIDPATGQITRDVSVGRGRALGVAFTQGGVYVVVDGPDGAALVRCTTAGDCP